MPEDPSAPSPRNPPPLATRVGIVVLVTTLILILLLALWKSAQVLLLFFAGALLAVILRTAANGIARRTPLSERWSLTVVIILLFGILGTAGWIAAPSVKEQIVSLRSSLSESIEMVREKIEDTEMGDEAIEEASEATGRATSNGGMLAKVGGMFMTTLNAVGGALLAVVIGIFLAYHPKLYLAGFLRLVPVGKRKRTCQVFAAVGETLQGWLLGQLISMAFLFITTWVMLALLGVPLAFILAVLTGLATFIPYIGPFIALVPILLVAFVEDPTLALYTGLLYLGIQNVEGNVLMPIIFQKTVHMPPAITIVGQLVLGAIFGVLGFILATPLTAVAIVLVQKLYVEDVLGDSMEEDVKSTPELPNSA